MILAWVIVFSSHPGCMEQGGAISLSASTSSARLYFQYKLAQALEIQASIPLAIGNEVLTQSILAKSSFAAKSTIAGIELVAGKFSIDDAAGFLAKTDAIASSGLSVLSVSGSGSASDSWGVSIEAERWALFAAKGPLYSNAALQYVLADHPRRLAMAAGFLIDAQQEIKTALRYALPWIALSAGYFHSTLSVLARFQMLSDFQRIREIQTPLEWTKGAAARLDFSFHKGNSSIQGFAYAEAGNFISASGETAPYDALFYSRYDAVFSGSSIIKSIGIGTKIYSRQGVVLPEMGNLPAWGKYPDPFLARYWLDKGSINLKIDCAQRGFRIFDSQQVLDSAFSAGIFIEPSDWSTKLQMDFRIRDVYKRYPQYGIHLAIQGSVALSEEEANVSTESETIIEASTETFKKNEDQVQQTNALLYLDKFLGGMQISLDYLFEAFFSRLTVAIPIRAEMPQTYSFKIQMGHSVGALRFEGSLTLEYMPKEKLISLPYARAYVRLKL